MHQILEDLDFQSMFPSKEESARGNSLHAETSALTAYVIDVTKR
jgi:hypothetical protein